MRDLETESPWWPDTASGPWITAAREVIPPSAERNVPAELLLAALEKGAPPHVLRQVVEVLRDRSLQEEGFRFIDAQSAPTLTRKFIEKGAFEGLKLLVDARGTQEGERALQDGIFDHYMGWRGTHASLYDDGVAALRKGLKPVLEPIRRKADLEATFLTNDAGASLSLARFFKQEDLSEMMHGIFSNSGSGMAVNRSKSVAEKA